MSVGAVSGVSGANGASGIGSFGALTENRKMDQQDTTGIAGHGDLNTNSAIKGNKLDINF